MSAKSIKLCFCLFCFLYLTLGSQLSASFNLSSFYGGTDDECGLSIAMDNNGDAILTGFTRSSDFPDVSTAQLKSLRNYSGGIDGYISKITKAGNEEWFRFVGGNGDDFITDIAINNLNNSIYIVGNTNSDDFETSLNSYQMYQNYEHGWSHFLMILDLQGNVTYSTLFASNPTSFSAFPHIALGDDGSVWIASNGPLTSYLEQPCTYSFLSILRKDGSFYYECIDTTIWDIAYSTINAQMVIVGFGMAPALLFPYKEFGDESDLTIICYYLNGTVTFASYIGGNQLEMYPRVAQDPNSGDVYVTAISTSCSIDPNYNKTNSCFSRLLIGFNFNKTLGTWKVKGSRMDNYTKNGANEIGLPISVSSSLLYVAGKSDDKKKSASINVFQSNLDKAIDFSFGNEYGPLIQDINVRNGTLIGYGYSNDNARFVNSTKLLQKSYSNTSMDSYFFSLIFRDGKAPPPYSPPDRISSSSTGSDKDHNGSSSLVSIVLAVVGAVIVVMAVSSYVYFVLRRRTDQEKQKKKEAEAKKDVEMIVEIKNQIRGSGYGISRSLDYDHNRPGLSSSDEAEEARRVSSELIQLDEIAILEMIGSGEFGTVYKGLWQQTTPVALKKLSDERQFGHFLREAELLLKLNHTNIVRCYGVYKSEDQGRCIVTEFMPEGNLISILHEKKLQLSMVDLLNFAKQASAGMRYLEKRNVIHRDLAGRNLLVRRENDGYIIKVADFGLSRSTYTGIYTTEDQQIPIRWSALESIIYGVYTSKSDVFSFGVVLWEIFSYGQIPYYGSIFSFSSVDSSKTAETQSNVSVVRSLLSGERLACPYGCPPEVYSLMMKCWNAEPEKRPNFIEIFNELNTISDNLDNPPKDPPQTEEP